MTNPQLCRKANCVPRGNNKSYLIPSPLSLNPRSDPTLFLCDCVLRASFYKRYINEAFSLSISTNERQLQSSSAVVTINKMRRNVQKQWWWMRWGGSWLRSCLVVGVFKLNICHQHSYLVLKALSVIKINHSMEILVGLKFWGLLERAVSAIAFNNAIIICRVLTRQSHSLFTNPKNLTWSDVNARLILSQFFRLCYPKTGKIGILDGGWRVWNEFWWVLDCYKKIGASVSRLKIFIQI